MFITFHVIKSAAKVLLFFEIRKKNRIFFGGIIAKLVKLVF